MDIQIIHREEDYYLGELDSFGLLSHILGRWWVYGMSATKGLWIAGQ